MTDSTRSVVEYEVQGHAALIRLNRPHVRNAMTLEMLAALEASLSEAAKDDQIIAVVITGAGSAFCAGLDLNHFSEDPETFGRLELPNWIRDVNKPVIAAVNGPAVTGGLELVLCCDYRLASDASFFADTHCRVGVIPGWGMTVHLNRLVGQSRALELSLSGRYIDSSEALQIGLVDRVVGSDELIPQALELVEQFANADRSASREIFRLYRSYRSDADEARLREEAKRSRAWNSGLDRRKVTERVDGLITHGRATTSKEDSSNETLKGGAHDRR